MFIKYILNEIKVKHFESPQAIVLIVFLSFCANIEKAAYL